MTELGSALVIIGGLMAFVTAIYLSMEDDKSDLSSSEWEDFFILAGIGAFLNGFTKGISNLAQKRSSSAALKAILFIAGVCMTGVGLWIIMM